MPCGRNLIAARKNVFKQASLIGYDTLFYVIIPRHHYR